MATKSKSVTKKPEAAVPATLMASMQQQAGAGLATRHDDFSLPFITILQALSPQLDPNEPSMFISGAKQGEFLNTATGEMWEANDGPLLLPVGYKRELVEWKPRKQGGGLVRIHHIDSDILNHTKRNDKNQDELPNGNYVVNTATHFVLSVDVDALHAEPGLIPLKSTQLKKSKKWNDLMRNVKIDDGKGGKFNPPTFGVLYKATAVPEKNEEGNWWGWHITFAGETAISGANSVINNEQLFKQAVEFSKMIESGVAKARYTDNDGTTSESAI